MANMTRSDNIPIVGIVGNFQRGKSTLVNCLLEGACALTGKRVATTKKSVYYRIGSGFAAYEVSKTAKRRKIDERKFRSGSVTADSNVTRYEVEVGAEILKSVSIVDTPGFDNDATDTATTLESLKVLDFVLLVVDKELKKSDAEVITYLQANSVPFSVVYNCSLNRGAFWKPSSEVNERIKTEIKSRITKFNSWHINGETVTNANFMWYWYSICKKRRMSPTTKEEEEAFADIEHLHIANPEAESNVSAVISFLKGEGLDIRNIQNLAVLKRAFDEYQNRIIKALS